MTDCKTMRHGLEILGRSYTVCFHHTTNGIWGFGWRRSFCYYVWILWLDLNNMIYIDPRTQAFSRDFAVLCFRKIGRIPRNRMLEIQRALFSLLSSLFSLLSSLFSLLCSLRIVSHPP